MKQDTTTKKKHTETITTLHSKITFTVNYPKFRTKNTISDITRAMHYIGIFDSLKAKPSKTTD